jgi:hypothetical protein
MQLFLLPGVRYARSRYSRKLAVEAVQVNDAAENISNDGNDAEDSAYKSLWILARHPVRSIK